MNEAAKLLSLLLSMRLETEGLFYVLDFEIWDRKETQVRLTSTTFEVRVGSSDLTRRPEALTDLLLDRLLKLRAAFAQRSRRETLPDLVSDKEQREARRALRRILKAKADYDRALRSAATHPPAKNGTRP